MLVLGNTGDPVLPYQDSVAMCRDLAHARLLTVDGYGHTEAANPSTCATDDEIRYLLTGALPPPRTVCQQNAAVFPGDDQPKADGPPPASKIGQVPHRRVRIAGDHAGM